MVQRLLCSMLLISLVTGGAWLSGEAAYIYLKAQLAQVMISSAWQESINSRETAKPWS